LIFLVLKVPRQCPLFLMIEIFHIAINLSWRLDDGGDNFLRNVGSHKSHTTSHPRRRHSWWNSVSSSGLEPETFQLVAYSLNHYTIMWSWKRLHYFEIWSIIRRSTFERNFMLRLGWLHLKHASQRGICCQRQRHFTAWCSGQISLFWRQAHWDSRSGMFLQLNPCGHSPQVTSSLTRGLDCRLWKGFAFLKCRHI
jgi:hypothetical protein